MSLTRRFLLAPSLARLIEKECGAYRLTEGFFPERADRSTYVRVGDGANYLILEGGPHSRGEQTVALPASHALALLEYTAGRVEYQEATLPLGDLAVSIHRLAAPGLIDFAAVGFDQEEHARAFAPPPWFGPEVTAAPKYRYRRIAFDGQPDMPETEVTDMALNSLLDVLQGQGTARQWA
jgi:CYTH domain-containing protein